MATYIDYSIRIEGRLKGTPEENEESFNNLFRKIFPREPNDKNWAPGFLPQGLQFACWNSSQSSGGARGDETIWSFFVKASIVRAGKMADDSNRDFLLEHHKGLLGYRDAQWYKYLRQQLEALNNTLADKLIERVWFREQQCVDGDGGDM